MKNELVGSPQVYKVVESKELRRAKNITQYQQEIFVIRDYKLVIRSKKKGMWYIDKEFS